MQKEENPFFPAVESFIGEVACGQGRVARHLADLGAHVVGIDLSAKLLAIARRSEETDLHPCFHTSQSGEMETPEGAVRTIGSYFAEGYWRSDTRPGPPGKVGVYHRTLSTYVNALTDAGLQLVRLSEPGMASDLANSPSLSGLSRPVWTQVPAILVAGCRKPRQGA